MPLNLPDKLPAIDLLKEENIFVIDNSRASTQDIRPLKIVILNLMPIKITTETDLIRLLSNSPLQIEVSFMKLKSHTSKNTPIEHMKAFYRDFECMRNEKFDGSKSRPMNCSITCRSLASILPPRLLIEILSESVNL